MITTCLKNGISVIRSRVTPFSPQLRHSDSICDIWSSMLSSVATNWPKSVNTLSVMSSVVATVYHRSHDKHAFGPKQSTFASVTTQKTVMSVPKRVDTLVMITDRVKNQILLGMKKRGFGSGKWNGFGGKVEPNETIEEAAKRFELSPKEQSADPCLHFKRVSRRMQSLLSDTGKGRSNELQVLRPLSD